MSLNAGNARQAIPSDPGLDKLFKEEYYQKQTNSFYQEMQIMRQKLPVYQQKAEIFENVEFSLRSQVTVICGETGCGKTTQIPQFILDEYITRGQGSQCHIVCTQPRRISAISVAQRVAAERAERCGGEGNAIGYQIRLENARPRNKGSILFCTTGIVLNRLESNPLLTGVSHLILDEIHERDVHSEFLLIIVKDILKKRPDLKLILMSATMNAKMFSDYYDNCPVYTIPGYLHPVEEFYLEDVVEMTGYRPSGQTRQGRGGRLKIDFQRWLAATSHLPQTKATLTSLFNDQNLDFDLVVSLIRLMDEKKEGGILVFLTGWDQISRLHEKLSQHTYFQSRPERFRILPLHGGMMSVEEQQQVFPTAPPGVRKIVLATNVAETSITIDDIVFVIDCGKVKLKNYNPGKNIVTLDDQWNSLANSKQRKGRAGRVREGHCFHLYTRHQESKLVESHPPEILRTRLEELCLQIKLLNRGAIMSFFEHAMEKPSKDAIQRSILHLRNLKALDIYEELTPLGTQLARMPVDPHIGKMLLFGAIFCCLDPILSIAACLDFKTPFNTPVDRSAKLRADKMKRDVAKKTCSDHLMFFNAISRWEDAREKGDGPGYVYRHFLAADTLRELKKRREQFASVLHEIGFVGSESPGDDDANIHSQNENLVRAVICAGLYPNVGMIKTTKFVPGLGTHYYNIETMMEEEVQLHAKSVNHDEAIPFPYIVYYQKMKTNKPFIFDSTGISLDPLIYFGEDLKLGDADEEGNVQVKIDNLVNFMTSATLAKELQTQRQEVWALLENKFANPCPTNWSDSDSDGWTMSEILTSISKGVDLTANE